MTAQSYREYKNVRPPERLTGSSTSRDRSRLEELELPNAFADDLLGADDAIASDVGEGTLEEFDLSERARENVRYRNVERLLR